MTLNFSTAPSVRARRRNARGIDQGVALAVALERHHDGIARRPRLIESHHPVLAQQPVDQRALADIRAADDGDLDAGRLDALVGLRASPASAASSKSITP